MADHLVLQSGAGHAMRIARTLQWASSVDTVRLPVVVLAAGFGLSEHSIVVDAIDGTPVLDIKPCIANSNIQ